MKKSPKVLFIFFTITVLFCLNTAIWSAEAPLNKPVLPLTTPSSEKVAPPLQAVPVTSSPEAKPATRLWNLQDADILSVINEVSQVTGKNFVVDPKVSGKITLVSSKPIKNADVYQVFLSVLGMLGYSAIPSGHVIKIVPNMESGEQSTPVIGDHKTGRAKGEEVVVRIIPLENVSASQLLPVLRPMLPQWSNVSTYVPGNVLILLGRASNLDKILTVIQDVDKASSSTIEVIPLKHAVATQLANVLNTLQNAGRSSGESSLAAIAVDERSNSLLISGVKSVKLRLRTLIAELDAPSRAPTGNTEVVYLRYLEAKSFAPVLGRVVQNMLGKGSSTNVTSGAGEVVTTQVMSNPARGTENSTYTVASRSDNTNFTNIQAEPTANALIITATPALMDSIKKVVSKLDVRPAQVMVEAIIAQVSESNVKTLGIQWGNLVNESSPAPSNTGGFAAPGVGVVGIIPGVHIQAVLNILQTLSGVDILSTPSVMVLDNRKAVIEIGQALPIITGQYTSPSSNNEQTGIATPFTTTNYRDVVLKLEVTPQINLANTVRLQIKLKNDTPAGTVTPGVNPVINTSSIQNSVLVNSHDVLVLGGLMSNAVNETNDRIPLFADIPVLGRFFERKSINRVKQTLMVFIKPTIVHDGFEGNLLSEKKYLHIKREQTNHGDALRNLDRASTVNRLPAWRNPRELPVPFGKEEQTV